MILKNLINKECCMILNSTTKTESLMEMMDAASGIEDLEGLRREIFYREQIMSTGIGQGIGIPHVRFEGVKEPRILVGIQPEGIEDYESLDGIPVKMVFMILVGADQHKEYLRILSLIVGRLKDEAVCQALVEADSPDEIRSVLTGEDA